MIDLVRRLDDALWRLPLWGRMALIAPVGLVCAVHDGWVEFRREFSLSWTFFMDYAKRGTDAL